METSKERNYSIENAAKRATEPEPNNSRKIVKLSHELDGICDFIHEKKNQLNSMIDETCEDALFLKAQISGFDEQKNLICCRMKQLLDKV